MSAIVTLKYARARHALPGEGYSSFRTHATALCGLSPGIYGWVNVGYTEHGQVPTCPRCKAKQKAAKPEGAV